LICPDRFYQLYDAEAIRWKTKVVRVEHRDDGALVEVETPAGTYALEAEWFVDATGANSKIRDEHYDMVIASRYLGDARSEDDDLLTGGTVKCWGRNNYGQLGRGNTTDSSSPALVTGVSNAVAIATGRWHACALLANGTVTCWGLNFTGQLGNGTTTNSPTSVSVSALTNAVAITAGEGFTCGQLANGTAKCWGDNQSGQVGTGSISTYEATQFINGILDAIKRDLEASVVA
jgi:hypothetical protein